MAGRLGIGAVTRYLDRERWSYDVFEHPPTFRAADEAAAAGVELYETAKTLVIRAHGGLRLVVLGASERLDLQKVRQLLGDESARLASEQEIASGLPLFEVGAVPPLGPMVSMPQIVDERLLERPGVVCSGGDHRHGLVVRPPEMARKANARVADVCED
jgi:Ala-tRNA(Pro) deacylase